MRRLRPLLFATALAMAGIAALHPEPAAARQSMSFAPGDRSRPHRQAAHARPRRAVRESAHRTGHRVAHGSAYGTAHATARHPVVQAGRHGTADTDDGPAAKAVPGAGFTMQDGVLTYPAPARFQPQNLKRN